MKAGIVVGSVVATHVVNGLEGERLLIVVPVDENDNPAGSEIIACDVVGAGEGARVVWVGGKEAALALRNQGLAVDAACVAILERHGQRDGR